MTNLPTPLKEVLADEALLAGLTATDAYDMEVGVKVGKAVQATFRTFSSYGLTPAFGWDRDDAERVWAASLNGFDPLLIVATATEWRESADGSYPTLGEFLRAVDVNQRAVRREAAIQRGMDHPTTTQTCPECFDGVSDPKEPNVGVENRPGWVQMDEGEYGNRKIRPCATCRPARHRAWQNGCFMKDHFGCKVCQPKGRR